MDEEDAGRGDAEYDSEDQNLVEVIIGTMRSR